MTNDGGPAFPTESLPSMQIPGGCTTAVQGSDGMTLRDYFAAQALALMFPEANALLAGQMDEPDLDGLFAQTARHSYRMADAMLAARSPQESEQ